ncbi:MAG: hypothetical protein RIR62_114 [Pseudomonadota bacterium]|jgi:hypothetical protein
MKNDELMLRLLTSQSVRVKLDEFVRLFRHRSAVPIYLLPVFIWVYTNVRDLAALPRWVSVAIYLVALLAFLLVLIGVIWLLRRIITGPAVLTLHASPVVFAATAAGMAAGEITALRLGAVPMADAGQVLGYLVFFWLIAELTLGLGVGLVVPRALAEMRAAAKPAPTDDAPGDPAPAVAATATGQQILRIGDRDIPLADLSHIVGEGNAVRVHAGGAALRLATRFPSVIAAVPPRAGMQIARAVWVAATPAARARLRQSGRGAALQLADGTELPVAQNRRTEVAAWLRSLDRETVR